MEGIDLIVGGTFNNDGGKPSSIIDKLRNSINNGCWGALKYHILNGGTLHQLLNIDYNTLRSLIWMPNIDNKEDKLIDNIKSKNPHLLLISSKRVVEKDYTESDVVGRLLKTRSNLGIMITKPTNWYYFKLLDPLGNQYKETDDVEILASALIKRITFLLKSQRVGSRRLSYSADTEVHNVTLNIFNEYGEKFSTFVNAVNPNRFLGNTATRCSYGFPAVRADDKKGYLISQRNVNKTGLTSENFVRVLPYESEVLYYGDRKPSVDSPTDIRLFNYYPKINYIIHGHCYVKDAPFTISKYPCGDIREVEEIIGMFPDTELDQIHINLNGHGCLILTSDRFMFNNIKLEARPLPEK